MLLYSSVLHCLLFLVVQASALKPAKLESVSNGTVYDYIIVGGGLSGLVVANRLTENTSILVVEYGYIDNSTETLWPVNALGLNIADMFSNLNSTPQVHLADQSFPVWIRAVVGGGSIVNGMDYVRGSAADYDAWEQLGNEGWGWDSMLQYFRKSATFTPNPPSVMAEYNYTFYPAAYGNGPLQASFPDYQYPEMPDFWKATQELGLPHQVEGALGKIGTYWALESKDLVSQTRSSARTAYYDPIRTRPNLHLLTGHYVQKLELEGLTAKGVEVISRADNSSLLAFARREVILAAGAVHTPQILQLSGIGPEQVLQAAGIDVRLDVPAVGANFQDHPVMYLTWNLTKDTVPNATSLTTDPAFNQTAYQEYITNRTGPYTMAHGNGANFLPLQTIAPTEYGSIASNLSSQNASSYLPTIYSNEEALLSGFLAQRRILTQAFNYPNASVYELPFNGGGAAATALQKPLSRGTIMLSPTNPCGPPIIDYSAFSNPIDATILAASVRFTRSFFATDALAKYAPVELAPGSNVTSPQALLDSGLVQPSFAHPSGSCAMMPREFGGRVDSQLRVYGTRNLRVVDASIMPLIPGAHLQATVYAVAEKAADIILGRQTSVV